MPIDRSLMQELCADYWWLVLLRGLAVLTLGVLLMTRPGATLIVLAQFLGAYWLVDGVFTIANSLRGRKVVPDFGWGLFVGFLGVIAGCVVFARPAAAAVLATTFVVYFIAITAIVSGVSSIVTGLRVRRELNNEWSMILGGVIYLLFGLLLIGRPLVSAATLFWMLGLLAVIGGVGFVMVSFKVRSIGKQVATAG